MLSFKNLIILTTVSWVTIVTLALMRDLPEAITAVYVGATIFWIAGPPFVFYSIIRYLRWIVRAFQSGNDSRES
jgi:hypothetical protein